MKTMFKPAPFFLEAPLVRRKPAANTYEIQLKRWGEEVDFYLRLLTWGLLSCREENRASLEALITHLNRLNEFNLPALKDRLNFIQSPADTPVNQVQQETADLSNRFSFFDQYLQQLKAKIFKGFTQFARVQIW